MYFDHSLPLKKFWLRHWYEVKTAKIVTTKIIRPNVFKNKQVESVKLIIFKTTILNL